MRIIAPIEGLHFSAFIIIVIIIIIIIIIINDMNTYNYYNNIVQMRVHMYIIAMR